MSEAKVETDVPELVMLENEVLSVLMAAMLVETVAMLVLRALLTAMKSLF